MILAWLVRRRREKILAEPFPAKWLDYLHENVALYRHLTETEQAKLRDDLRIFIAEKNWEGCGGQEITDEIKVTIAAQACLLVLAREHDYYKTVQSILVYPHGYVAPHRQPSAGGIIEEGRSGRLGEAWYRGPVVLSWEDAKRGGQRGSDGSNLVFHEFAHELDMQDGASNGAPPLADAQARQRWGDVMKAEYDRHVLLSEAGRVTLLDHYGATNPAEFFAVATECFFERPIKMKQKHPELYELLSAYYHQDPAARAARSTLTPT